MNINILAMNTNKSTEPIYENAQELEEGTKVHVVLVVLGTLCVLLLFGCIGVISWGGWKINQQDEAVADLKNLKNLNKTLQDQTENLSQKVEKVNEKSQNETKKLSSQMENINKTLQEETEKLGKIVENQNEKSQNETKNLSWIILLLLKFNLYPVEQHCNGTECLLCQTGWIYFSDSCYFISDVDLTWDQSRRFCQDKSADLVVINNQQEQQFIYDKINTNKYYWLGLQRDGSNWVWIDGRINTLRFWSSSSYSDSYAYMRQTGNPTSSWFSATNTYQYSYWNQYYPYSYYYYYYSYPSPLCEQKALKLSLN